MKAGSNVSEPSLGLLVKLGSLIVHADEFMSDDGHAFDRDAFRSGMADPEVKAWLDRMDKCALLPRKRRADA